MQGRQGGRVFYKVVQIWTERDGSKFQEQQAGWACDYLVHERAKKEEINYKDGKFEGAQIKWFEDGTQKSRYNWKDDEIVDIE